MNMLHCFTNIFWTLSFGLPLFIWCLIFRQKTDKATRLSNIGKICNLSYYIRTCWKHWNLHPTNMLLLLLAFTGEKLLWFQGQLDPEKTTYTRKDACEIIERWKTRLQMVFACLVCVYWCSLGPCVTPCRYLQRFDSELEQIELMNGIKGRQGRLHGAREDVIKQTIERERAQFEGIGFGECSSYKKHT